MLSPRDLFIDPNVAVKVHSAFGIAWFVIGTPVTLIWLSNSVAFVSWMSLYAIVIGHWSGLQAALADRRIKEEPVKCEDSE